MCEPCTLLGEFSLSLGLMDPFPVNGAWCPGSIEFTNFFKSLGGWDGERQQQGEGGKDVPLELVKQPTAALT